MPKKKEPKALTMESLIADGFSIVIRSPTKTTLDPPPWWSTELDDKWVIECYDHTEKTMLLGMGETYEDSLKDLQTALNPETSVDQGEFDLKVLEKSSIITPDNNGILH